MRRDGLAGNRAGGETSWRETSWRGDELAGRRVAGRRVSGKNWRGDELAGRRLAGVAFGGETGWRGVALEESRWGSRVEGVTWADTRWQEFARGGD